MKHSTFALAASIAIFGCQGSAVRPPDSTLSEAEHARARSVPSHANSTLTHLGRTYYGSSVIAVEVGPGSVGDRITLQITGLVQDPPATLGGVILLPEDALTLAAEGLDLDITDAQYIRNPGSFGGEELDLPMARAQIRADPDGLFVATYTFTGADGADVIVESAGRLIGGCVFIDEEGSVLRVADISTYPRCEQVLGSF